MPAALQGSSSVLYLVWYILGNIPVLADLTLFTFLSWFLVTKNPQGDVKRRGHPKTFLWQLGVKEWCAGQCCVELPWQPQMSCYFYSGECSPSSVPWRRMISPASQKTQRVLPHQHLLSPQLWVNRALLPCFRDSFDIPARAVFVWTQHRSKALFCDTNI